MPTSRMPQRVIPRPVSPGPGDGRSDAGGGGGGGGGGAVLSRLGARRPLAAKVPEITLMFWVIKVLTTGMGESASDYLSKISIPLAAAVGLVGFAVSLWLQFRSPRYFAPAYWFAVAMVAVFGTMAADGLHVGLGIAYGVSTTFYAGVVAVLFLLWYRSERSLSIHGIVTVRREVFYWLTVLATFALGTAAGDLTAVTLRLGYLDSAVLFAALITVPALLWWKFGLPPVPAFWCAYVLTRPLGASVADWFGKPRSHAAGLGFDDGPVTLVMAVLILAAVGYLTVSRRDIQPPR